MNQIRENIQQEQNKPLFIVSDFHGVYDAIELVEDKLNKKNRRVVILGDCMDRGNEGMRLLSRIKELIENGESLTYIPGNHDDVLYTKFKRFIEVYRNNKDDITEEMVNIVKPFAKSLKFDGLAKANGQTATYDEIIEMVSTPEGLKKFFELMIWLGEQPLLKIETDCDGRKIAMGHAAFDMDLYEMDEPLTLRSKQMIERRYEELKSSNPESEAFETIKRKREKAFACLWYRNPDDVNRMNLNNIVRLPDESEADVIVIGHTPKQEEVEIIGENLTREAVCVDGGTVECYLSGEGEMIKFEPYRESLPSKTMVTSFVLVGKKGAYERLGLMDEYKKSDEELEEDDSDMRIYNPPKKKNQDQGDDFGDI